MIRSTINLFILFAGFKLALTATKFIAQYCENISYRIFSIPVHPYLSKKRIR